MGTKEERKKENSISCDTYLDSLLSTSKAWHTKLGGNFPFSTLGCGRHAFLTFYKVAKVNPISSHVFRNEAICHSPTPCQLILYIHQYITQRLKLKRARDSVLVIQIRDYNIGEVLVLAVPCSLNIISVVFIRSIEHQ